MTGPLVLLAIPAFLAGFGIFARRFLPLPVEKEAVAIVPILAIAAMILGLGLGLMIYRNKAEEPINLGAFRRKLNFDEFYGWLIRWTQGVLSNIFSFFDRWILDAGGVRGAGSATWGVGALLRLFQVGNLQAYAFLFGLGIVGLIYFTVFR
jgi:NADH-quinone oxidoreductase subunit L